MFVDSALSFLKSSLESQSVDVSSIADTNVRDPRCKNEIVKAHVCLVSSPTLNLELTGVLFKGR